MLQIPRGLPRGLIEARSMLSPRTAGNTIPRGLPRGLIEASRTAWRSRLSGAIPRGLPRGLIEAPARMRRCARCVYRFRGDFPAASLKQVKRQKSSFQPRGFRGDFPAASLKQQGQPARRHSQQPIPRGLPRGLIEADGSGGRPRKGAARFRGDFPAASLANAGPQRHSAGRDGLPRAFSAGTNPSAFTPEICAASATAASPPFLLARHVRCPTA